MSIFVILNSIQYRPTGRSGVGLISMMGSLYSCILDSDQESEDTGNEPIEAQCNSIGSAIQADSQESDPETGERIWCFQEVPRVQSDESCSGVDACAVCALDQPQRRM